MKAFLLATALLGPALFGQAAGAFTGPAVLTNGLNNVGRRSGQDVDFRYFASANGIYDTGLSPFQLDSDGKLLKPDPVEGVEIGYGAYGSHNFRRSRLGLDYTGSYRNYTNNFNYDGNSQMLALGYTLQASRRWMLDMRADAGSQIYGTAFGPAFPGSGNPVDSTSMLFDNRTTYLQGSVHATYLLSPRTSITVGGNGSKTNRDAQALAGTVGYTATASIQHQLSRDFFVSVSYYHTHYDFTRQFGNSDSNNYMISFTKNFGRTWSATIGGGAFTSSVTSLQLIPLPPDLQEILGIPALPVISHHENVLPLYQISLSKQFRKSSFNASASSMVNQGNGVYLTSRQQSIGGSYAYTGFRNFSLSAGVGWSKLNSLGQGLKPYAQLNASANLTYNLGLGINLTAAYYHRHQEVVTGNYLTDSSRVSFGIAYSPSSIPLSFH